MRDIFENNKENGRYLRVTKTTMLLRGSRISFVEARRDKKFDCGYCSYITWNGMRQIFKRRENKTLNSEYTVHIV